MPQIELISHLRVEDAEGLTPDGVTIVHENDYREFSGDGANWIVLCVTWVSGISVPLIVTFLQKMIDRASRNPPNGKNDNLKGGQINRVWIDFEQGQMVRRIEECVEFGK